MHLLVAVCVQLQRETSKMENSLLFLRASAHGAERVNRWYRQNQRDEGGGLVSKFPENFVKIGFLVGFLIQVS